jgi:hypothetical protein
MKRSIEPAADSKRSAIAVSGRARRLLLTAFASALAVAVLARLPGHPGLIDPGGGLSSTEPAEAAAASTTATATTVSDAQPTPGPDQATLDGVGIGAAQIATAEVPTDLTFRPGDDGALYLTERAGRVRVFRRRGHITRTGARRHGRHLHGG